MFEEDFDTPADAGVTSTPAAPSSPAAGGNAPVPVSSGAAPATAGEGDAASAEPNIQELPSAGDFDWSSYAGDNYDVFDERIRPWLEGAGNYWSARVKEATDLFDALSLGEADPRLSQLTSANEQATADLAALQKEFDAYRAEVDARQAEETERYFAWFKQEYSERLDASPDAWDSAKRLLSATYDAIDNGGKYPQLAVHELFELAESAGADKVDSAIKKISEGWPWEAVLQVYLTPPPAADTTTAQTAAPVDPKPEMNSSAELVDAGGEARAADLQTPKQPARTRPVRRAAAVADRLLQRSGK